LNSIIATINISGGPITHCTWNSTTGTTYQFNCTTSAVLSAINQVTCAINNSKSIQTGTNLSQYIRSGDCVGPVCHATLPNRKCDPTACGYIPVVENTYPLCTNKIEDDCDKPVLLIDDQDPDCYGVELSGVVYNADQPLSEGWTLQNVEVKTSPPGLNSSFELSNRTNFRGEYYLAKPFVGEYLTRARMNGYIDTFESVLILSNTIKPTPTNLNFSMYSGLNCNENCADQNNYCNPACNGLSFNRTNSSGSVLEFNCTYLTKLCDSRPRGFKIAYTDIDLATGEEMYNEITCCEGPKTIRLNVKAEVQGNVEAIADYVSPVKVGGRLFNMHILVWSK
jgi:hypothetical protein